jgi:hypothetical protein
MQEPRNNPEAVKQAQRDFIRNRLNGQSPYGEVAFCRIRYSVRITRYSEVVF